MAHILFDYHAEAKSDKNLSKLMAHVRTSLVKFGFFTRKADRSERYEIGNIRVGCQLVMGHFSSPAEFLAELFHALCKIPKALKVISLLF